MNHDNKKINWLPFISICSLFVVIGSVGWFMGIDTTPLAAGFVIMGMIANFDFLLPPEFNFRDFWYNYIKTGTHIILILFAIVCSVFFLFFIVPKYEFNFPIKKKK